LIHRCLIMSLLCNPLSVRARESLRVSAQSSALNIPKEGCVTSKISLATHLRIPTSSSAATSYYESRSAWTNISTRTGLACMNQFPQLSLHSTLPQVYQTVQHEQLYNPQHCSVPSSKMAGVLPGNVTMVPVQFLPGLMNTQQPFFTVMSTSPQPNSSIRPTTSCTPMYSFTKSSVMPNQLHLNKNNSKVCTVPNPLYRCVSPVPFQPIVHRRKKTTAAELNTLNHSSAGERPTTESISSLNHPRNKIEENVELRNEDGDLWSGESNYSECLHNGASNLFVNWSGTVPELFDKLRNHNFEVRKVCKTSDNGIFNVIFDNHLNARKAFIMQRESHLRMIPPKNSSRNWFRNPSSEFLVKFETKCRLVLKKGKAQCHSVVGHLLMSSCKEQKGCLILVDKLKGNRMRVVSSEGKFMFPGGRVVELNGEANEYSLKTPLGWITYRCKRTRELYITRRSGNQLHDYIYTE